MIALAGFMGADGVTLVAAPPMARMRYGWLPPASILLFHATAVLAPSRWRTVAHLHRPIAIAAAFGLVIAAGLFSGDMTLRQVAGHGLFPMAAPTGGSC